MCVYTHINGFQGFVYKDAPTYCSVAVLTLDIQMATTTGSTGWSAAQHDVVTVLFVNCSLPCGISLCQHTRMHASVHSNL